MKSDYLELMEEKRSRELWLKIWKIILCLGLIIFLAIVFCSPLPAAYTHAEYLKRLNYSKESKLLGLGDKSLFRNCTPYPSIENYEFIFCISHDWKKEICRTAYNTDSDPTTECVKNLR